MKMIPCYAFRFMTYFIKQHYKTLLDIGIGEGEQLRYWHDKGLITAGCDNNQEFLDAARAKRFIAKNVDLNDTNVPLPWSDHSFDVVTIAHVLEHLESPKWVVEEALRITSDIVIISAPLGKSYFSEDHINFWFGLEEVLEALVPVGTVFYFEPMISKVSDVNKVVQDKLNPAEGEAYLNDIGFVMVLYPNIEGKVTDDFSMDNPLSSAAGRYNGKETERVD